MIFIILFFFLPLFETFGQNSLQDCSYLIFGFSPSSKIYTATGCFIKEDQRTYFLSANHVFSGFNSDGQKRSDYPETLYINLRNKITGERVKYPVDISKYKMSDPATLNFQSPDFVFFEINNPELYQINSIENFLPNNEVQDSDIEYIKGYGYFQKVAKDFNAILELKPLPFSGITKGEYAFNMFLNKYNKIDSINYYAYPTDYLNLQGASGAPVFQILKSGQIVFGGIYTASNPTEKIYIFVRPKYIMRAIKKDSIDVKF